MMTNYVILIPSFNDWDCLNLLIPKIEQALKNTDENIDVLIVNDASTKINNLKIDNVVKIKTIKVLNLRKNVKAQIALATGLKHLEEKSFNGGIIVMDADGQDDPEHLLNIINESKNDLDKTIVVMRSQRDDHFVFKIFYYLYLFLALLFTFQYMKFGVFSYINSNSIKKMFSNNAIYYAYAAALAKNFKNKKVIFAPRRKRIIGKSQNNYQSLIHYSLKIISVFKKQVLINSSLLIVSLIIFFHLNILPIYCLILIGFLFIFNFLLYFVGKKVDDNIEINNLLKNIISIDILI
jgi:polyisoprenyl-phosphate glycosyltransferase